MLLSTLTPMYLALLSLTSVSNTVHCRSTALSTRDYKIMELENALERLQDKEVFPSVDAVQRSRTRLSAIESSIGWFPSASEKDRRAAAREELRVAEYSLARVERKALDLRSRLKPLYGVWSPEFYHEHKASLKKTFEVVHDASYNSAWWSSVFSRRAESFTEAIMGFLLEWLMSYLVLYPFAGAYFLAWVTPTTIWAYSSSFSDIFTGAAVWFMSLTAFLLPLGLLLGGLYLWMKGRRRTRNFPSSNFSQNRKDV